MLAVVGDIFGVVLDDDNGLSMVLIQVPKHLVDPVGMHGIQLGDGLIQDEDVRLKGHCSCQSQQVGLAAGQLPNIILFPPLQPAQLQGVTAPVQVVGKGIVQAGIGGVIQHRGPDDLVFKVLVDIAHLPGQDSHFTLPGIQTAYHCFPLHLPRNEVGNQAVEDLAQSGLSASVVSNDRQKVPLLDLKGNIPQGRLSGAWIGVGQAVDLNRIHVSSPQLSYRHFFSRSEGLRWR